jgi:outer membrane protein OmpA-like peptidoglycan-associated protein
MKMTVSKILMNALHAFAATSLVMLAGCAQQQTVADAEQPPVVKEEKAKARTVEKVGAVQATASEEVLPDYANMNPVPIAFDKMSVKLRDADKQILVKIKERAQKAKRVVITGYCDRKQVGNSKDAAIARAVAVREELVRLGVKPGTVRIKHVTSVVNKHAAEIELLAAT